MFVGSSNIDREYLKKIYRNPDRIREYSNSLIPQEFRHLEILRDNQLYFVCMTLRKIGITDYKTLQNTIRELLKGVRITGYTDEVTDITFLYNIVNMNKVKLYLERL